MPIIRHPFAFILMNESRQTQGYLTPRKRFRYRFDPRGGGGGGRYEVGESSSAATARPARGLRADYGFVTTMDREIRRDLERDVGYGITDTWDDMVEDLQGTPVVTDVAEFSQTMTKFKTMVRQDTDEVYTRRQKQFIEALKLLKRLQTQMTEFERQQGPAKGPVQPDAPEEAGSSS
ncbi:hypothetical protein Tco_1202236 [Tanacetum coccineum]